MIDWEHRRVSRKKGREDALLTQNLGELLALPCLALPCLALPCLALPCLALPCLVLSHLTLPYLTLLFLSPIVTSLLPQILKFLISSHLISHILPFTILYFALFLVFCLSQAHDADLAHIALNADGSRLGTASEKGTLIRLWDCHTGKQGRKVIHSFIHSYIEHACTVREGEMCFGLGHICI